MDVSIGIIILFAISIAIIESLAQNTLKQSQIHTCNIRYYCGILFYVFVGMFLHHTYHHVNLSTMNLVWSSFSIILGITSGYLLYDEAINGYTILAILCALAAVYCSYLGSL
jgi:multidrug transporter EmrE-like cation transporter